jgi:dTDP-4-dehydrorhamnose reductase
MPYERIPFIPQGKRPKPCCGAERSGGAGRCSGKVKLGRPKLYGIWRMTGLELWGGHECTVNRVGDAYFDQTIRSGHQDRAGDLDRFAELGIKALRYPVLWERVSPDAPDRRDFAWSDERLGGLRELGVRPIVGLVHHGSGPRYTNLLDPNFAKGLAAHARAVAERYPWVAEWTPVNEPLTTARFSALYGHWYPHHRDERSFWTALLNQIDAVRLSMAEIRKVNPEARLIQTEDLGRTYSTRDVAEQAGFDNQRRWMSWDLLCGRVNRDHPLWLRISRQGLGDRLKAIADDPCPPDVLGINHYLTSDRFLDHATEAYPPETRGGNAFLRFADVEAIRVLQPAPGGLQGAIQEAWERYGRPIAVTEAHNGCTREDQVRWFRDAWRTAESLRARNVDVRAVTAWALLGSYDWNSLLTRDDGHYEAGVYDLRGGAPRATAMVPTLQALSSGGPLHPAVHGPGWWDRDIRLQHKPVFRSLEHPEPRSHRARLDLPAEPVMIVGATGTLGQAFARACEWRGIDYVLTDRGILRLDDPASIGAALDRYQPWAVVNAAGWVRVDEAEAEREACMAANAHGVLNLAAACRDRGVQLATFSSDLVFDGALGRAYVEGDEPRALNVYGQSKVEAERGVLAMGGRPLVVRTAAFFSPYDGYNFAAHVARQLTRGHEVGAANDLVVSPTYVPDLVDATLDLLIDGETGLWHLANPGEISWAEFAVAIANRLGLDAGLVRPKPAASFGWAAARPAFAPLASERALLMPPLDAAIDRYAALAGSLHRAEADPSGQAPRKAFG